MAGQMRYGKIEKSERIKAYNLVTILSNNNFKHQQ